MQGHMTEKKGGGAPWGTTELGHSCEDFSDTDLLPGMSQGCLGSDPHIWDQP